MDQFIRSGEVNNRLQLADLFLNLSQEMQSESVFTRSLHGIVQYPGSRDKGQSVDQLDVYLTQ